jgi:hypothetical protein
MCISYQIKLYNIPISISFFVFVCLYLYLSIYLYHYICMYTYIFIFVYVYLRTYLDPYLYIFRLDGFTRLFFKKCCPIITGLFFKKCCPIIKGDVMAAVNSFHSLHCSDLNMLNRANIALIPRKRGPKV